MILIEVCSVLLSIVVTKLRRGWKLGLASLSAVGTLITFILLAGTVHAFSLDRPRVQSYIGQPLNVFIPINGAENERLDANELIVAKPSAEQAQRVGVSAEDHANYQYQVVKIGDQLGALVTSKEPLKEPYANLVLQISYQGESRIKPYSILLDLPPSIPSAPNHLAALPDDEVVDHSASTSSSAASTYSLDMMGAYDWAQQGAIPKKFGPVINGQSLWRVARRINQAMGVSIDQMAWGLYRANPEAFTTESVESLQAGSVLVIPDETFVREVTEMQAVRLLAEKAATPQQTSQQQEANLTTADQTEAATSENVNTAEQGATNSSETLPEFAMSGVDSSRADQEVIATLNTTVAELSEQLLIRDRRITFLEKQIEQLTGIKPEDIASDEIKVPDDVANTVETSQVEDGDVVAIADVEPELDLTDEQRAEQGEVVADEPNVIDGDVQVAPEAVEETLPSDTPVNVDVVQQDAATPQQPAVVELDKPDQTLPLNNSDVAGSNFWDWKKYLLLALLALVAAGVFLRKKVAGFFKQRFSDDDEIVLNVPSVIDSPSRAAAQEVTFSDISSDEVSVVVEDKEGGIALDDFDDDFFLEDAESVDVEEVHLSDRIKELLSEGNFDAAKKTLEFANEADMDEKYLDFCRLKIFAAEKNKAEFAKTFNRVNRRINDFHPDIQFRIAELHREMFDSDAVIDFGFIDEEDSK